MPLVDEVDAPCGCRREWMMRGDDQEVGAFTDSSASSGGWAHRSAGVPDEPIYRSGDVTVTRTLVRLGGTSYPVDGIAGVRIRTEPPPSPRWPAIGGGVLAVGGLAGLLRGDGSVELALFLLGIAACLGWLAYRRVNWRPDYVLMLRTAGGERRGLVSKRLHHLLATKVAIEQAVARRG